MLKLADLTKHILETSITVEVGGEKQKCRVAFRDLPVQAHSQLVDEADAEAVRLQKEYEAAKKTFDEAENKTEISAPALPPTGQQIYLSKIVEMFPDIEGEPGTIIEPTLENIMKFPTSIVRGMNKAISEKMFGVEQGKSQG